jgi:proteic killer suppression protein
MWAHVARLDQHRNSIISIFGISILTHIAFVLYALLAAGMKVRFDDDALESLETDSSKDGGYPTGIPRAYRKVMNLIRNAPDERVFYAMAGSLRYEKLKPPYDHQHSMRLNDQWRLVLEYEGKGASRVVVVVGIRDYH